MRGIEIDRQSLKDASAVVKRVKANLTKETSHMREQLVNIPNERALPKKWLRFNYHGESAPEEHDVCSPGPLVTVASAERHVLGTLHITFRS